VTEVLLGATLPQFTGDPDPFAEGARQAEEAGLDSVWVFDHIWPLTGGRRRSILESWTSLAYVAAETERIRIGTLVTRSSLRHPPVLAKMAATVAEIAPGRLTVAIGSGDEASRAENESYGIPYFPGDKRVPQLRSTVEVVARYLTQDSVDVSNDFVHVDGLPPSPRPAERPLVWVGGRGDDVLEVAAAHADGWNGWGGTPRRFRQDASTVAELAGGRAMEISWAGQVVLGRDKNDAAERLGDRDPKRFVVGGPSEVAAALSAFVEAGARHVVCTLPGRQPPGTYELLASGVKSRING
jgi:alkanesulfonate monooxygenase SsuD/methylene tetrahydromethanopterin reductase-like flavin-dependent oxidoreductase (luciferase family)